MMSIGLMMMCSPLVVMITQSSSTAQMIVGPALP